MKSKDGVSPRDAHHLNNQPKNFQIKHSNYQCKLYNNEYLYMWEFKMTITVTVQAQLIVGEAQVIESLAPEGSYTAVFEDDGQTGYFYALDESADGNPIKDALHIYNAEDVSDGHIPSDVKIGRSEDSKKCVLLINGYPHGVFNFESKNGYCRSGFPPTISQEWSVFGHAWNDAVDDLFR